MLLIKAAFCFCTNDRNSYSTEKQTNKEIKTYNPSCPLLIQYVQCFSSNWL